MTTRAKKSCSSIPSAPLKENNGLSPPEPEAPDVPLPEDERPKRTREAAGAGEEDNDEAELSPNMIEMKQSACDIMHRSGHGSEEVFDRHFRTHFGASLVVATYVWELLLRESELPAEATMLRFFVVTDADDELRYRRSQLHEGCRCRRADFSRMGLVFHP